MKFIPLSGVKVEGGEKGGIYILQWIDCIPSCMLDLHQVQLRQALEQHLRQEIKTLRIPQKGILTAIFFSNLAKELSPFRKECIRH